MNLNIVVSVVFQPPITAHGKCKFSGIDQSPACSTVLSKPINTIGTQFIVFDNIIFCSIITCWSIKIVKTPNKILQYANWLKCL